MSGSAKKLLHAAAGTLAASGGGTYVEDVFATHLYKGNGSTKTITNGIDLDDKGGMVWTKNRPTGYSGSIVDTERGIKSDLRPSGNDAAGTMSSSAGLTEFNDDGYTVNQWASWGSLNTTEQHVSWTFRKQEGFFDVVTWTGNATGSRAISHALNAKVGMIIVKCTSHAQNWAVYHSGVSTGTGYLNTTSAFASGSGNGAFGDSSYNNIAPTTSVFYVGTDNEVNGSSRTYVAYVFAEGTDSGSQIFGEDGDEAIIKTGSFTPTGSGTAKQTINVGFEPQWLLLKNATSTQSGNWWIFDNMRGFTAGDGSGSEYLLADTTGAASAFGAGSINITNQGFEMVNNAFVSSSQTFIYMAIRRGPMKEPEAGTDVFMADAAGSESAPGFISGFPVDLGYSLSGAHGGTPYWTSRLTGTNLFNTIAAAAESSNANYDFDFQNGMYSHQPHSDGTGAVFAHMFRRYPKVFDIVAYKGDGATGTSPTHNLGVIPELKFIKNRDGSFGWVVGGSIISGVGGRDDNLVLETDAAKVSGSNYWEAADTATTFSVRGGNNLSGADGVQYVAYLFASLDGISKVGTYSGTGNDVNVTGLGAAARFVMIKRTDNTGDWYLFDSIVMGIVSGNDKYQLMNTNAAWVTDTDYIDPHASGFTITSSAPSALNANGGTYLYLAIS